MTADELRDILDRLGWSQLALARFLEANPRTIRRWMLGEIAVPGVVALVMRAIYERPSLAAEINPEFEG